MAYIDLNLLVAAVILVPAFAAFQSQKPSNSLYWMIASIILSNIYLSFEFDAKNNLVFSNHFASSLVTFTVLLISSSIIYFAIRRTADNATRKIYPSIAVTEVFIILLGLLYFATNPNFSQLFTNSLFCLGAMIIYVGVMLVITENNLHKTIIGLLTIQNGAHILINFYYPSIPLGYSIILNGMQIFIVIILEWLVYRQFKDTNSVLLQDISVLKY